MNRIASPQDLQAEVHRLLAYSQSPKPSREKLASELRELANRVAGHSYTIDWMWVLFVPARKPVPFNIDTITEINHTFIDAADDEGEVIPISLSVKNTKGGGYLTFQQEKQGLRVETLVQVQFPKGADEAAFRALQNVGRKFGFKVEKSAPTYKPGVRKTAAYGYESLPASEVEVGDYLVERDGAALEVEDIQQSGSTITFTLKPYGMTRVAPQKVRATTRLRVQKKHRD